MEGEERNGRGAVDWASCTAGKRKKEKERTPVLFH